MGSRKQNNKNAINVKRRKASPNIYIFPHIYIFMNLRERPSFSKTSNPQTPSVLGSQLCYAQTKTQSSPIIPENF